LGLKPSDIEFHSLYQNLINDQRIKGFMNPQDRRRRKQHNKVSEKEEEKKRKKKNISEREGLLL